MAVELFYKNPKKNLISEIPGIVKFIFLCGFSFLCFTGINGNSFVLPAGVLLVSVVLVFVTKTSLKNVATLFSFIIIYSILIFLIKTLRFDFSISSFREIYRVISFEKHELSGALLYIVRFSSGLILSSVFFQNTSKSEISDFFSYPGRFFCKISGKPWKPSISIYAGAVLNLIPAVFDKWNQIRKAQKARHPGKVRLRNSVYLIAVQITAVLSSSISYTENYYKAVRNRENTD